MIAERTPDVAVVVPTYQRAHRLPSLVDALEAQTLAPDRFEVVIVDDGSTDDTADVLARLAEQSPLRLRVVSKENGGPAAARNRGWPETAAPVVAFTDDDCTPQPGWLEAGLATLASRHEVGVVQGRTMARPDVELMAYSATRIVERLSGLFEGCNLFVRRAALEISGGFDERFSWYGEDTSFCWTILESGWEPAFAPDAIVHHDVTNPPFRRHLWERWMEGNLVTLARMHPRMRHEVFWRPWCFRRDNLLFVLAAVGAVASTRRRLALVLALPYVRARWPHDISRASAEITAKRLVVDATICTTMARASVRERIFVL